MIYLYLPQRYPYFLHTMPGKASHLTPLGIMIDRAGFSVSHVLDKSGIDRNRLAYLRTKPNSIISLWEAKALAPVFKMTIDQLAEELERIEGENR
jgi:hypothetical protein